VQRFRRASTPPIHKGSFRGIRWNRESWLFRARDYVAVLAANPQLERWGMSLVATGQAVLSRTRRGISTAHVN
jgi:hypothetical protein